METVNARQLADLIDGFGGQFFSVKFVKRTDGSVREMLCRKGVHKFDNGGGLKFDPRAKNLVSVWDAQVGDASGHRFINLDGLLGAKLSGVEYSVS